MPAFWGDPITVSFRPELTASRGKLLSRAKTGMPVHAGSRIRQREMVLESELLENRNELIRIFIHETHHFVWARLGNPRRRAFEEVLAREMAAKARGELGWSAEMIKRQLGPADQRSRSRKWRSYVCEAFCDTAACLYSPAPSHDEWSLAESWRRKRAGCLEAFYNEKGYVRV
jgi:hypothetical protein